VTSAGSDATWSGGAQRPARRSPPLIGLGDRHCGYPRCHELAKGVALAGRALETLPAALEAQPVAKAQPVAEVMRAELRPADQGKSEGPAAKVDPWQRAT
jgi:hypothetical protein